MAYIIDEKDKNGIHIRCELSQWENHIIQGHSMMENNIDAIRETIVDPDYIYESHDSDPPPERRIYTKKVSGATYYSSKVPFTHVVVSIDGGYGEVITAYPAKKHYSGSTGEEALYIADREPEI